jgi:hypothetical protein
MEMRVDPIDDFILPVILDWWTVRNLGAMDRDILPPVGFVASDREGPAAAAWIYQPVGCKVAILDWLVTRPFLHTAAARAACRLVFETCTIRARYDGALHLFASVSRPAMVNEAAAVGFHIVSTDNTHLAKLL